MSATLDIQALEKTLVELDGAAALTRDDVAEVLRDYGNHIGVRDLEMDEHGAGGLRFDDDGLELALAHLPQFPGIVAVAELDPAIRRDAELLKRLLQANLSWQLTLGGCFAVIPPRKALVLCRLIGFLDRDLERIDREFASFVDLVRRWQEALEVGLLLDDRDLIRQMAFGEGIIRP